MLRRIIKRFYERTPIVGVDIGSGFIKLAEIDSGSGIPLLLTVGSVAVPTNFDINISSQLKLLTTELRQLLIASGCRSQVAVISISSKLIEVHFKWYPIMDQRELTKTISWEIKALTANGRYYCDYTVISQTGFAEQCGVLIVVAPQLLVDGLLALANDCSLKLAAIELDFLALARLSNGSVDIMLDIGAKQSQLALIAGGCPVAFKRIGEGSDHFMTDNADIADLEIAEIRQFSRRQTESVSITSKFQRGLSSSVSMIGDEITRLQQLVPGVAASTLVLTGGGTGLTNLSAQLERVTGLKVVELDVLSTVQLSPGLDPFLVRSLSGQLGAAVGLALRGYKP